jgi:hypothetical protein
LGGAIVESGDCWGSEKEGYEVEEERVSFVFPLLYCWNENLIDYLHTKAHFHVLIFFFVVLQLIGALLVVASMGLWKVKVTG